MTTKPTVKLRISSPSLRQGNDPGGDYAIVDESGLVVGEAYAFVATDEIRPARENALLWAAAPDLLAALRAVEWVGTGWGQEYECPWCNGRRDEGHAQDCLRQAATKKARGDK